MTQNIKGMNQSIRNAGDAISLIQVAEGATNEITAMLQRMSELAVQSSNSTYSTEQRGYLDQEFQQLKQEIVRISETHEWNGFPILNGKAGTPVGYPIVTTDARPAVMADAKGLALKEGDLVIEVLKADGTKVPALIPASLASDDTVSSEIATSSNKSGSAIAIAAAINKMVGTTGVRATAVAAQINATKTVVGAKSVQTDLYVNGTKISLSLTAGQTVGERRQYVIDTINANSAEHGVIAGDGGNGGLSLKTVDGRNLSVWYDKSSGIKGQDFGLGGSGDVAIDPDGVTGVSGASLAGASALNSTETATISFPTIFKGQSYTLNGLKFNATATVPASDLAEIFSNLTSGITGKDATTLKSPAIASFGSFDSETKFDTGSFTTGSVVDSKVVVTSTGNGNVDDITQDLTGTRLNATVSSPTKTFVAALNGPPVVALVKQQNTVTFQDILKDETVTLAGLTFTANTKVTGAQLATIFASKLASAAATSPSGSFGTTTLSSSWELPSGGAASGSELVIQATSTSTSTSTTSLLSSSVITPPVVINPTKTQGSGVFASTVYGTVTLNSNSAFTIRPGANAYPSGSTAAKDASFTNFTQLGFNADTINAKSIGRLSFQVGPSPDQLISIDLADFGQNGEITGAITSSTAPTNILTVQAANDVTQSVNKSLDMIAQTRASMGAVMNRLEHVIDNLTNVVMNSEASRSQIEDADYAKASTELARTQIMQQAATAVLAQANTSQQSVLKLLQA